MKWSELKVILLCLHGSRAYGLNTETSDWDIKGIAIPDRRYIIGIQNFEQIEFKGLPLELVAYNERNFMSIKPDETEGVVYDYRKFIRLAIDCNPNIIELLFGADEDIIHITEQGKIIRNQRDIFLSKKAKFTFSGYAIAQLKRIKGHKKWLLEPPTHKPERSEFNLPTDPIFDTEHLNAIMAIPTEYIVEQYREMATNEKRFTTALTEWNQYQSWKKDRNPARSKLEADFGYDTKHAMHLMRLMHMGIEILKEGKVHVKRADREFLLDVRAGKYPYEWIVKKAEELDQEMNEWYEKSTLPHTPNHKAAEQLIEELTP